MLITFKSRAFSDVTMFGDIALRLLKLMDGRKSTQGIIEPDELPEALAKLRAGVADADRQPNEADAKDSEDDQAEQVSLHNRALPLIDLLQAAISENEPVTWDEGSRGF